MNTETITEPTIVPLHPNTEVEPLCPETTRRRRGKVAQLPKAIRDKINTMLEDGLTYAKILEQLGDDAKDITISNLSKWFEGGYKDYLRHRDWADQLRDRQEQFLTGTGTDPVELANAGMQIAATGLCELVDELSRLKTSDENASDKFARLTNSLSRLARMILTYEQHRQSVAKAKAAEPKLRDPNKPFGDESDHRAVVAIVDRVLGLRNYTPATIEELPTANEGRDNRAGEPDVPASSSSEISNLKSEITPTPEMSPEPAAPAKTDTIKWVPIEERPWNWSEWAEYSAMSSFPPSDYVPPPNDQPPTLN
ncbi:MAG: hypothetical protein ACXWJB_10930 [Limisphaerales bacterium]